jgi:acylphosphatase
MPPARLEVVFRGRVQGVGFRATTRSAALSAGVTGWVRNEADGSVRCVAEGEPGRLKAFIEQLRKQMASYIETFEQRTDQAVGEFSSFTVRF